MNSLKKILIPLIITITACSENHRDSDAWGNFEARETIISSEASGRLLLFDIEQGQTLEKGILVGVIDTIQAAINLTHLTAKKDALRAKMADTDAQTNVLTTQMSVIETEVERTRRLLEDKAATAQQFDEIIGKRDILQKQIQAVSVSKNSVAAEIRAIKAQIAQAQEQLQKCYITNPVKGTILEKYTEQHELVMPGKPLYKIADLSVMELKVYISGLQLPHIQLGQKVKVRIDEDSRSNREMEGTISWISSKAEFTPKTIQTKEERVDLVYAVKINTPNDGSIKIGMPGEVKFQSTPTK